MVTYCFRLRFFVHAVGVIQYEERVFNFSLSDGTPIKISCLDEDTISNGKEFVLFGGGFGSELEAQNVGARLKKALILCGPKVQIGIDAGKDIASARMSTGLKNMYFEESGEKIIENVHGLSVFSEEYPVKTFSMSALLVCPSTVHTFTTTVVNFFGKNVELSDKEILCLELYGLSHFEKSDRARFLTLVLALETLLLPEDRSKEAQSLIDIFLEHTDRSNLSIEEKASIKGSLKWLYRNSISQSLKNMANYFLENKEYNGVPSVKFISQCYEARSKLVHTGKVNEVKINLGILAAQLNLFIADLIEAKIGERSI